MNIRELIHATHTAVKRALKTGSLWVFFSKRKRKKQQTTKIYDILTSATLTSANLTGADLRGADLTGAYLGDADLRDDDLLWRTDGTKD